MLIRERCAVEYFYCLPNLAKPNLRYPSGAMFLPRGQTLPAIVDKSNQYMVKKLKGTMKSPLRNFVSNAVLNSSYEMCQD